MAQFALGMAGVAVLLASSRSYDMGRFVRMLGAFLLALTTPALAGPTYIRP